MHGILNDIMRSCKDYLLYSSGRWGTVMVPHYTHDIIEEVGIQAEVINLVNVCADGIPYCF